MALCILIQDVDIFLVKTNVEDWVLVRVLVLANKLVLLVQRNVGVILFILSVVGHQNVVLSRLSVDYFALDQPHEGLQNMLWSLVAFVIIITIRCVFFLP